MTMLPLDCIVQPHHSTSQQKYYHYNHHYIIIPIIASSEYIKINRNFLLRNTTYHIEGCQSDVVGHIWSVRVLATVVAKAKRSAANFGCVQGHWTAASTTLTTAINSGLVEIDST